MDPSNKAAERIKSGIVVECSFAVARSASFCATRGLELPAHPFRSGNRNDRCGSHSAIGRVPKQDPEIVFPRTALTALAHQGAIGAVSPYHFSFMGGVRDTQEVEDELAPAIAAELKKAAVDLALLVPY